MQGALGRLKQRDRPSGAECQRIGISALRTRSGDGPGPDNGVHGKSGQRMFGVVRLVLLSGLILAGVGVALRGTADSELSSRTMFTAPWPPPASR